MGKDYEIYDKMKEYDRKKHTNYLIDLGFRELIEQDKEKLQQIYFEGYHRWYIYEGDLELDELIIGTASLVVTGNLTIRQPFIDIDEGDGCLFVLGKTKVNYISLGQDAGFYGGIEFEILYTTDDGEIKIYNPKGRLLYSDSEGVDIEGLDPKKVEVYINYNYPEENFGNITKLLPQKYLYYDLVEDEDILTYEQYLEENEDEDWNGYVADMGLGIDDIRSIWEDIVNGKKVFLK